MSFVVTQYGDLWFVHFICYFCVKKSLILILFFFLNNDHTSLEYCNYIHNI